MATEDPAYWTSVYSDTKTVLRFLGTFVPWVSRALKLLSFVELVYAIESGHGIQPSDPNYNAPVGNSPANI